MQMRFIRYDTINDTIEEFNMDSKAEYSALSSTHSQKKYKKEETKTNKRQCPFNSVQVKIREGSPFDVVVIISFAIVCCMFSILYILRGACLSCYWMSDMQM